MCATCTFPQRDGSSLCAQCSVARQAAPAVIQTAAPALLRGKKCALHPAVDAAHLCSVCGTPLCSTCVFTFPGGVQTCPDCATKPRTSLSPKRKRLLACSYGLAAWATLGIIVIFSGALAGSVSSQQELEALGIFIFVVVFVPALGGIGLAFASMERKLGNPPWVWGAVIWNCITVGILMLLTLVGTFMG